MTFSPRSNIEPPTFAVAMPAFNAEGTIAEAVSSVLAQTFTAWELAVVDDGSDDRTAEIVTQVAEGDPRVRIHRQANAGCAAARATAVELSTARYIIRLDADDSLVPACLETYAGFIADHPERDIYSCDATIVGPDGKENGTYACRFLGDDPRYRAVTELTLEEMLEYNRIVGPAAVCTREIYERAGGMRQQAYTEDYDLWLRALAAGGRHIYLPQALVRYRLGPGQMTASRDKIAAGCAESLTHVVATGNLDQRLIGIAKASAAQYSAQAVLLRGQRERETLETRLRAGKLAHARRDFLLARRGYSSFTKYTVAAPLVLLSPRAYAAYLRRKQQPEGRRHS
jgi:hypothetical protein